MSHLYSLASFFTFSDLTLIFPVLIDLFGLGVTKWTDSTGNKPKSLLKNSDKLYPSVVKEDYVIFSPRAAFEHSVKLNGPHSWLTDT